MDRQGYITLIEDDGQHQPALLEILRGAGCQVSIVGRCECASSAARLPKADLIIMEQCGENVNVRETLAFVQSQLRDSAVLLLTGASTEPQEAAPALPFSLTDILQLPPVPNQLLHKADVLIKRAQYKRLNEQKTRRLSSLLSWTINSIFASGAKLFTRDRELQRLKAVYLLARRWGLSLGISTPELEELSAAAAASAWKNMTESDLRAQSGPDNVPAYPAGFPQHQSSLPALLVKNTLEWFARPQKQPVFAEPYRDLLSYGFSGLTNSSDSPDAQDSHAAADLGLALLAAGDWIGAAEVFQSCGSQNDPQAAVQAKLCLAEIVRLSRHFSSVSVYIEEAVRLSENLGPKIYAQTLLQSALCLMRSGLPRSQVYLEKSRRILRLLNLQPDLSRAVLAYDIYTVQPEQEFLQALSRWNSLDNLPYLCLDAPWLIPHLLQRGAGAGADNIPFHRHMQYLALYCRHQFQQCLNDKTLSNAARSAAGCYLRGQVPQPPQTAFPESDPKCGTSSALVCEQLAVPYDLPCEQDGILATSLGSACVSLGTRSIADGDWPTRKTKYLFFYLLCHPRGVLEDLIIEEFWPSDWEKGRQNLYHATSSLRRVLKQLHINSKNWIHRQNGQLRWQADKQLWFDLSEVRRLAVRTHSSESLAAWQQLLSLIKGPFLPDCMQNWAELIRTELTDLQSSGLSWLSQFYQERHQSAESLEYAQRLLKIDATNQQACQLALQAHIQLGETERAVRLYRSFCAKLQREFDALPSTSLIRLYHQAKLGLQT